LLRSNSSKLLAGLRLRLRLRLLLLLLLGHLMMLLLWVRVRSLLQAASHPPLVVLQPLLLVRGLWLVLVDWVGSHFH
jgi:hypothetical protein